MGKEDGGRKTRSHDDTPLGVAHSKSFHSISSSYFGTVLKITSLCLFLCSKAWWVLHKISCLIGGTCPGATWRTLFRQSLDTLCSTPISPSNNTRSDREVRGLFKIAPHRHSLLKIWTTSKKGSRKLWTPAPTFSSCAVWLVGSHHPNWIRG